MTAPAKSPYERSTHAYESAHGAVEKNAWVVMAVQYLRVNSPTWIGFTAEDVAIDMQVHGYPKAADARWWGSVMQQAKRAGIISQFGDGSRTELTRAGHRTPLWKGGRA